MSRFFKVGTLLLAALPVLLFAALVKAQTPPSIDKVFSLAVSRADDDAIILRWTIAAGNYLYRDHLKATLEGKPLSLDLPAGQAKEDPSFGRVEIYHDRTEGRLSGLPRSGNLDVSYQGCAEQGICYPPITKSIDLATLAVADVRPGVGGDEDVSAAPPAQGKDQAAPSTSEAPADPASSYLAGNVFLMAAAFLGFGLLLAFTPCVFPMIPILSAMLAGAGERLTTGRSFVLSAAYVLAMAAAYGIVGLVAGWSGANLQTALQTPIALSLAAAVFIILALSMFGFYEIGLPAALSTRLAGGAQNGGSVLGAAVLGLGSALIVGPCVTPPLAAAMLFAVQSGEAMKGATALFFLGLGMGLPLIAFGTFGARILPRSGPWMVRVRQVFGAVFLGVAVMLVARLMSPPEALALWGVLAVGVGIFLGGLDTLRVASGWQRRLGKTAGIVAFLYGATLIIGAAGGAGDPTRPLAFLAADRGVAQVQSLATLQTDSPASFDAALTAHSGKPLLVSFKADWCIVCKENEAIMQQPDIRQRLTSLPIIDVDVTKQNADAQTLMTRFSVVGPPTLFLLDADGHEIPGSRMIGPITADDLARRLSQAGA